MLLNSIRLNKQIRTDIIASIATAFIENYKENYGLPKDIDEVLDTELRNAVSKVYAEVYKGIDFTKIPKLFVNKYWTIYVAFFNKYASVTFERPWPAHTQCIASISEAKTAIYLRRYKDLASKKDAMEKERNTIVKEATTILDTVNTTKQLVDLWPEVESYLPAYIVSPSKVINLPAISTSRLNQKLGV